MQKIKLKKVGGGGGRKICAMPGLLEMFSSEILYDASDAQLRFLSRWGLHQRAYANYEIWFTSFSVKRILIHYPGLFQAALKISKNEL